jgi:hypothetical protein
MNKTLTVLLSIMFMVCIYAISHIHSKNIYWKYERSAEAVKSCEVQAMSKIDFYKGDGDLDNIDTLWSSDKQLGNLRDYYDLRFTHCLRLNGIE